MASYSFTGSQHTWFTLLDTNGVFAGTAGTIANGSDAGMGRLEGVRTVSVGIPEGVAIPYPGDNGNKGTQLIGSEAAVEGSIVTSIEDLTFTTKSQGTSTSTIGDATAQPLGIQCPTYASMAVIVNSPALNQTPGSKGVKGWHAYLVMSIQSQPRGVDSIESSTAADFQHKIVATYADKFFWEAAISAVTHGTTNMLVYDLGFSAYPWTAHNFKGDGAATTFTLDETPAAASSDKVVYWKDGAIQAYTTNYTVTVATKTVTLVAAPAAGTDNVVLYQYVATC